jgi:hypothetical protein
MYSDKINGSKRFTSAILKLDTAYVESICANYFDDNIVTKADKVLSSYYPKPEFSCPLCNAGDKKRGHRPACLIPTEVGYLFKCLKCMENSGAISLYNLLLKINPDVAKNYQLDRWVKKVAGSGFNVPEPPKNEKREYYLRLEEEQKEHNKIDYQRRNGLSIL